MNVTIQRLSIDVTNKMNNMILCILYIIKYIKVRVFHLHNI